MTLIKPVAEIVAESTNPLLAIHHSWKRVSLGLIAEILNGYAFESRKFSQVKGFPLLRIRDVGKNVTECFYDGEYDSTYIIRKGDLLVGMDGDFNSAVWTGDAAILNQRVCKVFANRNYYDPKFLEIVLPAYLKEINKNTSSVTVKHLSSKSVGEIPLPLPPQKEQARIVSRVEELFSFLDAGVDSLRKVQAQLKRYRQAVLKYAFEGKLTEEWRKTHKESAESLLDQILKNRSAELKNNRSISVEVTNLNKIPENWVWTTIGELFKVGSGGTPSRRKPEYWNGTIPWVSSGEVDFREIRGTKECISQEGLRNSSAKLYPTGTILMALYGEGKTRGQVAILEIDSTTNQAIACICCSKTLIPPKYVYWWLRYRYYETRRIREGANQPNMYLHHVQKIPIPLAPLNEQKEIIKEIEQLTSLANDLQETIRESLLQSERLRESILKHAFEGKLVAQDSSDEPAEILLQRIKAQRIDEVKKNSIGLMSYVK